MFDSTAMEEATTPLLLIATEPSVIVYPPPLLRLEPKGIRPGRDQSLDHCHAIRQH